MNQTRYDTVFSLRYATRVLERYARLWHRFDLALRILSLFSGTAAFGALMANNGEWMLVSGLFFAFVQTLETVLKPSKREHEARSVRDSYAAILSGQRGLSDDDLESEYQKAASHDPVIVPDAMRRLAYNDVSEEYGCEQNYLITLSPFDRALALIA